LTHSFKHFMLRAFMACLAVGFLLAGMVSTAYAAGSGNANSAGTSSAGGNSAKGNKGHIQIEGVPDCGTSPCGEDNDSHVSCTLTVEFFGYPSGTNSAHVTISGQQPSGTGTLSTDSFTFEGKSYPQGSALDTSRAYTFSATQLSAAGLTAQPQQGYHLRVDASVNGFPAKTHVVWYEPCTSGTGSGTGSQSSGNTGSGSTSTGTTPGDTSSGNTGLTGTRGLLTPTAGRAAETSAPVSTGLGGSAAPASTAGLPADAATLSVATARAAGSAPDSGGLAFTGFDVVVAVAAAAAALLLGFSFVVLSRRAKRVDV
jgi:hypothetical protein